LLYILRCLFIVVSLFSLYISGTLLFVSISQVICCKTASGMTYRLLG